MESYPVPNVWDESNDYNKGLGRRYVDANHLSQVDLQPVVLKLRTVAPASQIS